MEKFRGIPFKYLPRKDQVSLANQLDQDDGSGKDYIVFEQTLEKMCQFSFGIVQFDALKVLRSRGHPSPTLALFDQYYSRNPNITLDLVYMVLKQMDLEDCTAVLDDSWEEIKKRHESGEYILYVEEHREYDVHRCTCGSCRPLHSIDPGIVPSNTPRCRPPNTKLNCSQTPCQAPRPRHESSNTSSLHELRYHTGALNIDRNLSQEGSNLVRRGPAITPEVHRYPVPQDVPRGHPHHGHSSSTVQLPFYQGSSLKTPVTHVSTIPGPETGAIPKHPCEYRHVSISDDSPLSPLAIQSKADNRHCQNEPQTLQNDCNRYPPHVNDLGRDNMKPLRPVSDRQCTCLPSIRAECPTTPTMAAGGYQWFAPADYISDNSEDDESEQTKLLEVVGSSCSDRVSRCTCQSPTQSRASNSRQSSHRSDPERRKSDPTESSSSSDNCSNVRRSNSDEELKRNNLSPQGSLPPQIVPEPIRLFLTFADDSEAHLNEVLELGAKLKEMGFSVKCDMFDLTIRRLISQPVISTEMQSSMQQFFSNSHDWLDVQVQNASYLVFCISPKYFQYVRPQEHLFGPSTVAANSVRGARSTTASAEPNNCHLHAKYIYNQACSEHFRGLTQNKRFFPVLFQNSGATHNHMPSIFKSTLIFNYPDAHQSLLSFLRNQLTGRYH